MLDIYFVRHAESEMNTKPHLIGGQSNESPLTQKGIEQSKKLGSFLSDQQLSFDYAYCSTAERTKATLYEVFTEAGFPLKDVSYHDDILELSQGDREKKPRNEIYTEAQLKIMNKNNYAFRPPNGESQQDITDRYAKFMDVHVLSKNVINEKKKVYIQGHGLGIKFYLGEVLGMKKKHLRFIHLNNTSISRIQYEENPETRKLIGLNQHPHTY